jgi:hypothetical protein
MPGPYLDSCCCRDVLRNVNLLLVLADGAAAVAPDPSLPESLIGLSATAWALKAFVTALRRGTGPMGRS